MISRSTLAQIRFGVGFRPGHPATDPDELLTALGGPDRAKMRYPIESYQDRAAAARIYHTARRDGRLGDEEQEQFLEIRRQMRAAQAAQIGAAFARAVWSDDGLRERLTWFWADHFTTVGDRGTMIGSISAYVDEAIRPHVGGRFPDMFEAAVLHPIMIFYLDQEQSIGPNSPTGLRRNRSLNENLAREVLELHSMGVGAGYDQRDVRQLAELFTGLSVGPDHQLLFRPRNAEPGAETVLGQSYGGDGPAVLDDIRAVLRDLALRSETARHLSRKLADYFLSDDDNEAIIEGMTAAYLNSDGDLLEVLATMLEHPGAWSPELNKVKRPFHFVSSSLRALDVAPEVVASAPRGVLGRLALRPMTVMGQSWQAAAGPDGFFDDDQEWIRPQTLAARIGWAMSIPAQIADPLPDPRRFAYSCLRDAASESLIWAAARAETREAGIGLVLSSPEFQRS